ncbi:MAG: hypothetical protein NXI32_25800 [bacterium]|nr:hypothetical protein [bacterium]
MRRLVAGLLSICLILPLFGGCGGADTTPKEPGEFRPPPGSSAGGSAKEQKAEATSKVGQGAEPVM